MDKKLQIPHILQIGSSSWRDQVELPAGLGWHFFQVTALPSLKEYMEEEEISKFKALILEKPEDLCKRDPGISQISINFSMF